MASFIDQLLGGALNIAVTEAETYEPQVLAVLAAENVTIETAVDKFINSLQVGGALGLILPAIKGAVVAQINQLIDSQAAPQEKILFDLIVAAAKAEAAKLAAA